METGDLITENRPRRIVRRRPVERDAFKDLKQMVNGFVGSHFNEWFDNRRDGKLNKHFEEIIITCDRKDEYIIDIYRDEFIEDITNRWNEPKCPNFFKQYKLVNAEFTVRDFIQFWKDCVTWFDDNFDNELKMESEEQVWNTICFWVYQVELIDDWEELFTEKFNEELCDYKDIRNRTSRISCGVCYENTILYTGCSCCNNNYLCKKCYNKIDNECPFCRCDTMIREESFNKDVEFGIWFGAMSNVLRDIISFVEEDCDCKEKGYIYCPNCSK